MAANRTSFQPGNPGGPGRPRRVVERDYLAVAVGAVSAADWRKVVKKALEQAIKGDSRARDWLGRRLVGSDPIQVAKLVEELQAELQRLLEAAGHVHTNGDGEAATDGSSRADRTDESSGPGPTSPSPGADHGGSRPDAGRLADRLADLALPADAFTLQ